MAKRFADQGIPEWYGCSRCRYIRSGCISYKCNPAKFLAHYEKFPEKYNKKSKFLKPEISNDIKIVDVLGEKLESS